MIKKPYAAYGSNMHIEQMKMRCPDAYIIGIGRIEDYELEFKGVATISKHVGLFVPVVLWMISERDEIALDRYEGVSVGLYRKELIKVKLESINGENDVFDESDIPVELGAMVYIMNAESRSIFAPTRTYYETILEGYQHNNIDVRPLSVAAIKSDYRDTDYYEGYEIVRRRR
ncbi:MAG: gamma-glutamylcyclotransferase family protein [Paenibacillus dendritiformis]|uniref:gamma-glutamylcyclotransferase family protein n=1 Tax=uncultured Paenibacillus sp. TaxID=227322 RepID=UPI0025EB951A|nr:gamma-glutamylcyclotransferase family protein [uncultured Paenibacillus sp.]MDU5141853.1 gamma-glutamylcyclotransferase family protein [Paenibacillus dendritiformis]